MPKGRLHAPSTACDGVWFEHRGVTMDWPPKRMENTNTGQMLNEPYSPEKARCPPTPPPLYKSRDSRNFKDTNRFSAHDNRHSFQDHGVYFEDGRENRLLGKRLQGTDRRQHNTEPDFLKHYGRTKTDFDYHTVYHKTYKGCLTPDPPTYRRFPKVHREGKPGTAKLDTTTTDWYQSPDVPYKTPTHVLAISQEPFLGHNNFKYSYHGLSKCYPTYDRLDKKKSYPVWIVQGSAKSREIQATV